MSTNDLYLHKIIGNGDVTIIGTPDVEEFYKAWTRPISWPVNPVSEDVQITMLFEVFQNSQNFITFLCDGAYLVDWGDYSSDTMTANSVAQHTYSYNDLTEITPDEFGAKIVKITITPLPEESLTKLDLSVPPLELVGFEGTYSQIVELVINAPELNSLIFGGGAYDFLSLKSVIVGDTSLNACNFSDLRELREINFVGDVSSPQPHFIKNHKFFVYIYK